MLTFFGAIADIDIMNPVSIAKISGMINASDVLRGLFMSHNITRKKPLVANVVDEYTSFSLY
jgi:hypothetical protein